MKSMWTGFVALAFSTAALAQTPLRVSEVATAQPSRFNPLCDINAKKDARKAEDALMKGLEERKKFKEKLAEARTLVLKGVAQNANDGAGWYILARVYLYDGDVEGVDSAFKRAEKLLPACEADIENIRFNTWVTLTNTANSRHKDKKTDDAIRLLKVADRLYSLKPTAAANLGAIYWERNEMDSAAVYFAKAFKIVTPADAKPAAKTDSGAAKPKDARAAKAESLSVAERNGIAQSLAIIYDQLNRPKDAIPVLEKLVQWEPNNVDVRKLYVSALRKDGQNTKADSVEKIVVGALVKQNLDSLPFGDLIVIGANAYNSGKYSEAEGAFRAATKKNPYSWDALMNLATTLYQGKEYQKLVDLEKQLVGIAPLNENVYKLVGSAQQKLNNMSGALEAAEKLIGLMVVIDSTTIKVARTGASFRAIATGRDGQDPSGRSYPVKPIKLVFEFVTIDGKVVESKEVTIPGLKPNERHELKIEGKGEGIAGWRYREVKTE